jgi:hypothetical protein
LPDGRCGVRNTRSHTRVAALLTHANLSRNVSTRSSGPQSIRRSVPRSENTDLRADVPGGRVRRTMRDTSRDPHHRLKGGIQMAKKAAKGAKKKAAKKR